MTAAPAKATPPMQTEPGDPFQISNLKLHIADREAAV
jgi:hypothetical protein